MWYHRDVKYLWFSVGKEHDMKRKLALSLALLLCLTACGPKQVALEPIFQSLLPDEALRKKLSDSICTPEDMVSDGNSRLLQVVGDGMTLYLAVEVTFGTEISLDPDPAGSVYLYEGRLSEGSGPEALETLAKAKTDGWSLEALSTDPEKHRVTYFIMVKSPENLEGEKTLALQFHDRGEPLPEPTHYVSWTVENTAESWEMEMKTPDGEKVGTVTLTPFTLRTTIYPVSAVGFESDEILSKLQFLMKDGTTASVLGRSGGGSSSTSATVSIAFHIAQDLGKIQAVTLGECKAERP